MGILWCGMGGLITLVIWSGLAVYAADHVEHAWGKGGSFQVLCVLSIVATFFLMIGFGIGAAMAEHFPSGARAALLGGLNASVFVALMWLASEARAGSEASWALLFTLPFVGGLGPFLSRRANGK